MNVEELLNLLVTKSSHHLSRSQASRMCLFLSKGKSLLSFNFKVHSPSLVAASASLILSTTSLFNWYCFLWPVKWDSSYAAWGFLLLWDFDLATTLCRCFNSVAMACCCLRSSFAQSGGLEEAWGGEEQVQLFLLHWPLKFRSATWSLPLCSVERASGSYYKVKAA